MMKIYKTEIEQWIQKVCQQRFQKSITELSAVSLFYLYYEIESHFGIRIPLEKIEEGVLSSDKKLTDFLYGQIA